MFRNLPIGIKLSLGLGFLLLGLIFVAILSSRALSQLDHSFNEVIEEDLALIQAADEVLIFMLESRRNEKDFLLRLDDKYVAKHEASSLRLLETLGDINAPEYADSIAKATGAVTAYRDNFALVVAGLAKKGYNENLGLRGQMRDAVHEMERTIGGAGLTSLLQVRRREKDYMMRGTGVEKWRKTVADVRAQKDSTLLAVYERSFLELVAQDTTIKQNIANMGEHIYEIEPIFADLKEQVAQSASAKIVQVRLEANRRRMGLWVIQAVFVSLGLFIAVFTVRKITGPLGDVRSGICKLRDGDLMASFQYQSKDEMGEVVTALQSVLSALRETLMADHVNWDEIGAERKQQMEHLELEQIQAQELATKVERILGTVESAALGDLSIQCEVTGADACGQISEGLNKLISALRGSILAVGTKAGTLEESAQTLAKLSKEMQGSVVEAGTTAQRVELVSHELGETLVQITVAQEQMGETVSEIAQKAQEASDMAANAVNKAESTNKLVEQLGISSKEIGEVLDVITRIAGQTNLLALNATIEAASAGEAGRGFAVVADEVKNLAKQTTDSAQHIGEKIQAIQKSANDTIGAIAETAKLIMDINEIQAGIAVAVEEQSATANEITENVNHAAEGVGEIEKGMGNVADFADQTQKGTMDVAGSARSLSSVVMEMNQLVADFKT